MEAGHAGHHHVEQDEVKAPRGDQVERVGAIVAEDGQIAEMGQPAAEYIQIGPAVIDREDRANRAMASSGGLWIPEKLHRAQVHAVRSGIWRASWP